MVQVVHGISTWYYMTIDLNKHPFEWEVVSVCYVFIVVITSLHKILKDLTLIP